MPQRIVDSRRCHPSSGCDGVVDEGALNPLSSGARSRFQLLLQPQVEQGLHRDRLTVGVVGNFLGQLRFEDGQDDASPEIHLEVPLPSPVLVVREVVGVPEPSRLSNGGALLEYRIALPVRDHFVLAAPPSTSLVARRAER